MKTRISLEEYLHNPCGSFSIPYWKAKMLSIPESIVIYHEKDFCNQYSSYEKFFIPLEIVY